MSQQPSLPGFSVRRVVNVASVPHRSPFRYPGGKTWLVPRIRAWLANLQFCPADFIEPFAGGAIVGLTVAFEGLAEHVTLVELDEKVGAVWDTIINRGDGEWLAEQIETFDVTLENVTAFLARDDLALREKAFQTIVHNRVSRGGIMAEGAGLIKNGENGRGIASRWYPETLARRIRQIHLIRDRLSFVWRDGMTVIEERSNLSRAVFFIDPPYTAGKGKRAGRRLYDHSEIDHEQLFALMTKVQGDFLMTYDNNDSVRTMAKQYGFGVCPIAMKNTHHAKMTELLIGADLGWVVR